MRHVRGPFGMVSVDAVIARQVNLVHVTPKIGALLIVVSGGVRKDSWRVFSHKETLSHEEFFANGFLKGPLVRELSKEITDLVLVPYRMPPEPDSEALEPDSEALEPEWLHTLLLPTDTVEWESDTLHLMRGGKKMRIKLLPHKEQAIYIKL